MEAFIFRKETTGAILRGRKLWGGDARIEKNTGSFSLFGPGHRRTEMGKERRLGNFWKKEGGRRARMECSNRGTTPKRWTRNNETRIVAESLMKNCR